MTCGYPCDVEILQALDADASPGRPMDVHDIALAVHLRRPHLPGLDAERIRLLESTLRRLEAAGLVDLVIDASAGGRCHAAITDAGRRLLD